MLEFFQAGGWSMFVVLATGALTFASAIWLMARPHPRHVGMIRAFSIATVFSMVAGVASNLAAVFHNVAEREEWHGPDMPYVVMTGLAESLAPVVMGAGLLTLAWLVAGVGVRRLGALEVE